MLKKFSYMIKDKEGAFVLLEEQENTIQILKVFVNDAFRGQGLAKQLLDDIYLYLKNSNKKVIPICSYAVSYFEKNRDKQDIL